MPAIRDVVFSQEAVTTDGGLTIPICNYESGDLLFAFCFGDAAVTTWGCSNGVGTWTQLYTQNNTSAHTCYWKYATSGEGDVVFTASTNDTYSGILVCVRDVYQSYTSGSPPLSSSTTQAAATRFTLGTLTTSAANSLILHAVNNTASNGAMIFGEGAQLHLQTINGAAEGGAVGWTFEPASSTVTTAHVVSAGVSGTGAKAVIEVRAPAGGATVVPPYAAADGSVIMTIDPGKVYDSSSAIAATADTNFGTSIGGKTANDATVAASVADVGVDPKGFCSACGVTNAASATAISGADWTIGSTYYDVSGDNILLHLRSVTTVASQNVGAIGTTRGVWFGMQSGTTTGTNYKIWQVNGGDAPFYGVGVIPVIINDGNANTRATAGTLGNTDVRRYGFWMSGVGVLTGQMTLGSMWRMGATTVAGGNSAEPVDIAGLENVLTKGKIRWSAIRQGLNQLLCQQAVQFGNGGTDPVYLDLNATAIELPSQRNAAKKLVNYNGVDDAIGFTYYPGASDTIKHRSSVISSPSKYHWRIHASASASATYDFSGLSIIGAGDVQLRAVTTFTGMSFTLCPTITQNSAVISGCAFNDSKITSATLADMDNISNCAFTSGGTGHAIEVGGSASTITFTGNTFTGYASSNGSTGNEAIYVNIASGTVTINIAGGGSTPSIRTAGATVVVNNSVTLTITGLVTGSDIVITTSDTNTVILSVDAHSGTSYDYAYSYVAGTYIDIKVIKAGYVVYPVYDYLLANADASLPIAQVIDRAYI